MDLTKSPRTQQQTINHATRELVKEWPAPPSPEVWQNIRTLLTNMTIFSDTFVVEFLPDENRTVHSAEQTGSARAIRYEDLPTGTLRES